MLEANTPEPPAGAPVRILWLEDDPADAALGMERLHRAGLPFEADVVSSAEEFQAKLAASRYDIILADYRVSGWNGSDALDWVCSRLPDLPFILVTGQLDDETAVECIKKGAADYVLKSRLARLPVAVMRALEEKEREIRRQRAEAERAELVVREQAARAQAAAEARFRRLLEAAPDAIIEVDADGTIVVLNPAAECLFGYRREELLGRSIDLLVPEASRPAHQEMRDEYRANPVHRAVRSAREVRARHADGTEFPVEVSLSPVRSDEGDLVTCVVRDITYRKRAEEALRESHRRITSILESITDGFFALDREWRFTYVNRKAEQIVNRTRDVLLGRNLWDEFPELVGSQFDDEYRRAVAEQVPVEFTAHYPARQIWAEHHVYPSADGLSVFFQDVTARMQLEEQFRQSQKLEALGRLAGGVAHDFNNLLTIIGGYGQMLLEAAEPRSPAKRDLEAVVEAANRASALTRQLLTFSRRQVVQPKVFGLKSLMSRMNRMLRRVIGEDIEMELSLGSDVGRVKADPGQLEQVIMNLVVNARDAMPRGGRLTLETAEVELTAAAKIEPQPDLPPGRYVVLAIADTGTGMDRVTRSRLFEPFFTTKPRGKGTGLGLSTAYGIVKQSGGDITVETEPGRGSTFRIWLPREERPPRQARKPAPATVLRGSETVLLVEDEDEVRKLARSMLVRQGYKVIEAPDGPHALEVWERDGGSVDLLLTDVIMPRMSGRELAEKLTTLRPELKVLYMSGYTDDVIAQQGILDARTRLLQKPFSREALGTLVRRTLDGPAAPAARG